MIKIFTVASVPDELAHAWLQHLRDFDASHPGCRFEVIADAPELSVAEMVDALKVNPSLTVVEVMERHAGKGRKPE